MCACVDYYFSYKLCVSTSSPLKNVTDSSFKQYCPKYRSYECWIEGEWTFSDPWESPYFPQRSVEPPESLKCFSITEIVHGTHAIDCRNILETGFEAHQLKIEPQRNKFTWSGKKGEQPKPLDQPLRLPGYYVWFAPEVTLTKVQ